MALMQRYSGTGARVVFHQRKRKQKHARAADRKNPIGIDVRKRGGLGLESGIDSGQGLPLRIGQADAGAVELLGQTIECVAELRVVGIDMVTEGDLMKLRTSRNDGGHYGRANAGTDVACEIHQTGDGIALFTLYADV